MDLIEADDSHCSMTRIQECRKGCKFVSTGQAVLRHDMVTARAISRLSHSVAQLSASTNNVNSNATGARSLLRMRGSKQNFGGQKALTSDLTMPDSYNSKPNTIYTIREDGTKKAITGSKRKWESDMRNSHMTMDIDLRMPTEQQRISRVTTTQLTSQSVSTSNHNLARQSDSFMCLSDEADRYSSCSSMLSLSASSSSSSPSIHSRSGGAPSSDENEADGEGDGDESGPQSRYTSPAHSRTSISPFGAPGSHKSSQANSITNTSVKRLPRVPRGSVCGGDSSDGLSVNMKIPRLMHWPGPSPSSSTMTHKTHGTSRRLDVYGRGTGTQRSLCGCNRGLRQHRLQLKRDKSDLMLTDKPDLAVEVGRSCKHGRRNSVSSSSSRACVACRGAKSSTSSSSCSRDGSPSCLNQRQDSPESCEDLANDEQSDFPAEEFIFPRYRVNSSSFDVIRPAGAHRGTAWSRSDRPVGHSRRSSLTPSWRRDSTSAIAPGSPDLNEIDSELEEIMQGTWPLLSHRARLGYLEGVARAGSRVGRPSPLTNSASGPEAKRIDFVPSKLNQVNLTPTSSNTSINVDRKRMPTPPWIRGEDDSSVLCLDDVDAQNASLRSSENSGRAGFGSRAPFESLAEPIPQTNTGHKLLQRLGWEPGTGLGSDCQGMINPVGCAKFALTRPS